MSYIGASYILVHSGGRGVSDWTPLNLQLMKRVDTKTKSVDLGRMPLGQNVRLHGSFL